ncbi:cry2 [Bugula neritina]|uniref:Cry2 n=1 Tax=Bugula neritina TaxID=10212 RepID=A0A7J7K5U3_BUGNE|nr:cry2 [Bugula neritina]
MWVASFEERPRLTPASLLPSSNTLTPYLDLGCLSARRLYYEMNNLYRRVIEGRPEQTPYFSPWTVSDERIFLCRSKSE